MISIFILLALFELCCIYMVREETKAVSDSIALAVSQELLFFEHEGLDLIAKKMAEMSGCRLSRLDIGYDVIKVSVEKDIRIEMLARIGLGKLKTISSSSSAKITYPWDKKMGLCDYYEFGYKPY
jgi:hypothetical protein